VHWYWDNFEPRGEPPRSRQGTRVEEPLMRAMLLFLGLATLMFVNGSPASACEAAGPNTHVGAITAIDPTGRTLTLKDAETTKPIVFVVTSEQLRGIKVADEVAVTYRVDGDRLRATSIKRN